jgi:hypothetical protein
MDEHPLLGAVEEVLQMSLEDVVLEEMEDHAEREAVLRPEDPPSI